MCGIAAEANFRSKASEANVRMMTEAVAHRGPDGQGLWTSKRGTCVLGHRRLSVIDITKNGSQPMSDKKTGNTVTFNGEIYNHRELRAICEKKGVRFKSRSDTEVLLALYNIFGIAFLDKLHGMFSFVIWDEIKEEMIFAVDRLGKKPIFYNFENEILSLSSTLNSISKSTNIRCDLNMEAVQLFFHLNYIPSPLSIYRGIEKLPAGHYGVVSKNGIKIEKYWDLDFRKKISVDDGEALELFSYHLEEAVKIRLQSDVSLGAFLSGGRDSAVIVALMAKLSSTKVKTFTIGFENKIFDESDPAKEISKICGTEHHSIVISDPTTALLNAVGEHYGEPFGDPSAVPCFLLAQHAKQKISVALTGDGGDELLAGYTRASYPATNIRRQRILSAIKNPAKAESLCAVMGATLTQRVLRRSLVTAFPELGASAIYGGFFGPSDQRELLKGTGADESFLARWHCKWLDQSEQHAYEATDKILWQDTFTYLTNDILVKLDVASMHVGLEARSPYLDQHLVEFCATLQPSHKIRYGRGKYLLGQLAEMYFPSDLANRPKQGFSIPMIQWLDGPLREAVMDICHSRELMAPLNHDSVVDTLKQFYLKNNKYYAPRIWSLFMYGTWRANAPKKLSI